MKLLDKINLYEIVPKEPSLNLEIWSSICKVIDSKNFIAGPEVQEFERQWAQYCGYDHAVSLGSGTVALESIIKSHGELLGGKFIVPVNTYSATAMAVINAGYTPAFIDCNGQFGMDVTKLEYIIKTHRIAGIIPVHLYGIPENIKEINRIAGEHNIPVIEDAAQGHGAYIHGKNDRMYSFYPTKNLGCYGDAGIVVTNSRERAEWIEMWRNQGRVTGNTKDHRIAGTNSRMDTVQAAVLLAKMKYFSKWNEDRDLAADEYFAILSDMDEIILPPQKGVYSLFVIRVLNGKRDKVMSKLKEKGIGCSVHYPVPLHMQGAYKDMNYQKGDFPNAEKMAEEILSLPMHPYLCAGHVEVICDTIKEALEEY